VFPPGNYDNWVLCQQLLPHTQDVLSYDLDVGSSSVCRTELLINVSMFYSQRGQYKLAFILRKEIHDKAVTEKGEEHPSTLLALGNLASTYSDFSEAREAKKFEVGFLSLVRGLLVKRISIFMKI
jgi:hypothetical protein